MTRKHFEALAAALQTTKPSMGVCWNQWRADVDHLTDVCARFNPNFDRARFLKACGVEEDK